MSKQWQGVRKFLKYGVRQHRASKAGAFLSKMSRIPGGHCRSCYCEEMRREPEFFGSEELDLVYMARRLREALRLEKLLTHSGIDYCVETGEYTGGLLIRRELTGAFFYVAPPDLDRARALLSENKFKPYDVDRGR